MASMLPEELVQEILLLIPPDEPAHLVRAALVCKAWHCILSNGSFLRRYRRFHGTPPLLGYICNDTKNSTVRFVPVTSITSPVPAHALDCSGSRRPTALDCRHGRVLVETMNEMTLLVDNLIVWDPITGDQHNLGIPSFLKFLELHEASVLCAKDGCDHLDCHSGPFLVVVVVVVVTSNAGDNDDDGLVVGSTWASVYSSETRAWSSFPTPHIVNCYFSGGIVPSLLIGEDALYFATALLEDVIIKYDLRKRVLSVIDLPGLYWPILMKGDDGGLGFVRRLQDSIHLWSLKAGINDTEEWVKYRVIKLDKHVAKNGRLQDLICVVEGTNTMLIGTDTGIFTLDLKSEQVTKIGQRDRNYYGPILPYTSFYTPKY